MKHVLLDAISALDVSIQALGRPWSDIGTRRGDISTRCGNIGTQSGVTVISAIAVACVGITMKKRVWFFHKNNDTLSKGAGQYKLWLIFLYFISSKPKDGTLKEQNKQK